VPELWLTVLTVLAGAVTYMWRAAGMALAGRIDPQGRLIEWVGCVAYALVAGLVARMIILPVGPLAQTSATHRLLAAALAVAAYFAWRRSILAGVTAGAVVLAALHRLVG